MKSNDCNDSCDDSDFETEDSMYRHTKFVIFVTFCDMCDCHKWLCFSDV